MTEQNNYTVFGHGDSSITCDTNNEEISIMKTPRTFWALLNLNVNRDGKLVGPVRYHGIKYPSNNRSLLDTTPQYQITAEEQTFLKVTWKTDKRSLLRVIWDRILGKYVDRPENKYNLFPRSGRLYLHNQNKKKVPIRILRHPERSNLNPYLAKYVPSDCVSYNISTPQSRLYQVTYNYSQDYATHVVGPDGPGHFLERHSFIQTIALDPNAENQSGFVILGRWVDGDDTSDGDETSDGDAEAESRTLSLIGVKIKKGYVLILDPFCIHGDSHLAGEYMFEMTGNYLRMIGTDTVYMYNDGTNDKTTFQEY
jgi:hypothetical protein